MTAPAMTPFHIRRTRQSIAWAFRVYPAGIELPATLPELEHTPWRA